MWVTVDHFQGRDVGSHFVVVKYEHGGSLTYLLSYFMEQSPS